MPKDTVFDPEPRPEDQDTLRSLAAAYLTYGLPQKALSILQLAVWLDSSAMRTQLLLAYAAFRSGDTQTGISAIEKLRDGAMTVPEDLSQYYRCATTSA